MKRGEVWYCSFGNDPKGSEPAFDRPAVVVQDDLLTDSSIWTVLVVPMTSNLKRGQALGAVCLSARGVVERESVVLVAQVTALDRTRFRRRVGMLTRKQMAEVDRGLSLALGLSPTVG